MWIEAALKRLDRKKAPITFHPHLLTRQLERNFDLDIMEQAVRRGKIFVPKCQQPAKICFRHYDGKQNRTYYTIAIFHKYFIEVITTWLKKGK